MEKHQNVSEQNSGVICGTEGEILIFLNTLTDRTEVGLVCPYPVLTPVLTPSLANDR